MIKTFLSIHNEIHLYLSLLSGNQFIIKEDYFLVLFFTYNH